MNKDDFERDELSQNKTYNPLSSSLRVDDELFKEEDYIPQELVGVKRRKSSKYGEVWDIMVDSKSVLKLSGDKFTNKEKDFFRTPEGFRYLINGYRDGWKSVNKFKTMLKENDDYIQRTSKRK